MKYQLNKTFGINCPDTVTVEGGDDPNHPAIPAVDTNYVFRIDTLRAILAWYNLLSSGNTQDHLYLTGHMATGKTSLVEQICARLKIPLYQINGHMRLDFLDLVGSTQLIGGDTCFVDGPLTQAWRNGGWFLLNEQNLLNPATSAGLNDIGTMLPIPATGEQIKRHPKAAMLCTGNAINGGDHAALYSGVNRNNIAFMDRFIVVEVTYPDKPTETQIVMNKVKGINQSVVEVMVDVAQEVRGLFAPTDDSAPTCDLTLSTRTLIRWAQLSTFFAASPGVDSLRYAFDCALGNRADTVTRTAFHEILDRCFGKSSTATP